MIIPERPIRESVPIFHVPLTQEQLRAMHLEWLMYGELHIVTSDDYAVRVNGEDVIW